MAKKKVVLLGKNPKLSEIIAWAEQNNMRVEVGLRDRQSAQQSVQRIVLWARIKKWFGAIANR